MERLRPEDDYFLRCETDDAPMHIGALQRFERTDRATGSFATAFVDRLEQRLGATPLGRVRHEAPDEYDADVWCSAGRIDLADHVEVMPGPLDDTELRRLTADLATQRLDLDRPPFHAVVIDGLADGASAVIWRVHHAVADGIGFQRLMGLLTDGPGEHAGRVEISTAEQPPDREAWLEASKARFEREGAEREARAGERAAAKRALGEFDADPAHARTPVGKLARIRPSSRDRRYATIDLSLPRLRVVGASLGGTVNDALLATVSGAVRRFLIAAGELPDEPLLVQAARSYRRPEDGDFGNRIINVMPSLATDVADPAERFAAIASSMRIQIERSRLVEALLDDYDRPHGPRFRREDFEKTMQGGRRILPGPVVVSNVPGPDQPRTLAGWALRSSYPVPLLGYGRMLNVTSRRYLDALQCGVMTDPAMLDDIDAIVALLADSLDELEAAGR